jgi:Small-conductance mechanosensitive channel
MIARIFARLLLILCLALPLAVSAQDSTSPDYAQWDKAASAAEVQIEDNGTSNADLEQLRDTLVVWRESFLASENANGPRIDTLKAQIEALGPAPGEGESESAEIAQRRKELNKQLEAAQAPIKTAEEAYTRANGLIAEIDQVLNERQADALMELGPSPLNPTLWPGAFGALSHTAVEAWSSVAENAASKTGQATLKSNAATLLLYLLIALVLVTRGRAWSERLTGFVRARVRGEAGRGVIGFVASLSQIVVPLLGLVAITEAARVSGLLGPRGEVVFAAVPRIGLAYFFSRWITGRLLYATGSAEPVFDLSPARRIEATGMATLAGLMLTLDGMLSALVEIDGYDAGAQAVLAFPLVALAAFALFRLARILQATKPHSISEGGASGEEQSDTGFAVLIAGAVARAVLLASVLALALGAVGYMSAATGILYPLTLSLALMALLVVLARLAYDLYGLVTRHEDGAREALVPVLLSFALVVVSLPFFALIWGVREDRLWEIWAQMREGVSLGGVQISVTDLLMLVVVFAFGLGVTRLFKAALRSAILPKTRLDKGGQNAVIAGAGYVGVFLSAIVAITAAGIDLSALAIVAGALSVGIGFGLQNIVQNFVSGIILLIERPISEGDWIDLGNGSMGIVKDISVRSTRVETFDKTDLIVPNADLISNQVTNYTRGNLIGRVIIPVGVAYGTDTRKVEAILREIAEDQAMVAVNPKPQVLFLNFGADALEFEIRAILRDVTYILAVKNDINHAIAKRFAEEGIEIPFAQRDIWLRNPEALQPKPAQPAVPDATEPEREMIEPSDLHEESDAEGDAEGEST